MIDLRYKPTILGNKVILRPFESSGFKSNNIKCIFI